MRKFLLPIILACFSIQIQAQRIYVNANSSGNGSGDSWANAYISLTDALAAANTSNEVWVAAGTYKPIPDAIDPKLGTFYLQPGTKLYGGFAGTEAMLSERNIELNKTILNGDILGDDIAYSFDSLRSDNVYHVLVATETGGSYVVDGLTISGGQTSTVATDPDINLRGGGILSTAIISIQNCTFTGNYARSGGAVALLDAGATSSSIKDCTFYGNGCSNQGACVFIREVTAASVSNCVFRDNSSVNRGCLYPIDSENIIINDCDFLNNSAGADNLSGGFYSWQTSFTMTNCTFTRNIARSGAAVYHDGRDGGNFGKFVHCTFDANTNLGYGGTVYNYIANVEVEDCTFINNVAGSSAASIYNGGATVGTFRNTTFSGGTCSFGAGTANYGDGTITTYEDCTFTSNNAGTSGGALSVGFKGQVTAKNCILNNNTARFGGAIYMQNDTSGLTLQDCTILGNTATTTGGGLNVGAGANVMIERCLFEANTGNIGGAFACSEDSLIRPNVTISNTVFNLNIANEQGAGLNVNNGNINLSNCLFSENINVGVGAGGAISNNGSGFLGSSLTARNCTFYGNIAELGAGVANWQGDSSSCAYNSQNCIYDNIGTNYAIEDGTPNVLSLGGNLSTDATFAGYFTGTKDVNGGDPGFVDASNYDYTLLPTSIAVDGGVSDNVAATDLLGNPRVGDPDKGCYELQYVGIKAQIKPLALKILPNPTAIYLQINLDNSYMGKGQFAVYDLSGKLLLFEAFSKEAYNYSIQNSVAELPNGTYKAFVQLGKQPYAGLFVVQK